MFVEDIVGIYRISQKKCKKKCIYKKFGVCENFFVKWQLCILILIYAQGVDSPNGLMRFNTCYCSVCTMLAECIYHTCRLLHLWLLWRQRTKGLSDCNCMTSLSDCNCMTSLFGGYNWRPSRAQARCVCLITFFSNKILDSSLNL